MALFSANGIKFKVLPSFPANIEGDNGIVVEKNNGTFIVKDDFDTLSDLGTVDEVANYRLKVYDDINKVYYNISILDAISVDFVAPSLATEVEAIEGTSNSKIMTPLRVNQHVSSRIGQDIQPYSANLVGLSEYAEGSSGYPIPVTQDVTTGNVISSGVLTLDPSARRFRIDTEAAAATDDLTNVLATGGVEFLSDPTVEIYLAITSSSRDIVVKHNANASAGAILCSGGVDITLNSATQWVKLVKFSATQWIASRENIPVSGTTEIQAIQDEERRRLGISSSLATLSSFGATGNGTSDDTAAVNAAIASGRIVDGEGKTYFVNPMPQSLGLIKNSKFKSLVGGPITPTRDIFRADTSIITLDDMYTAWAQDSSYVIGKQIRAWAMEKLAHPSGQCRIFNVVSDTKGSSYRPKRFLFPQASGKTLWSAGYRTFSSEELLFVRVPSASVNDVAPYTYELWRRTVTPDVNGDYSEGAWTVTPITFPTVTGTVGLWDNNGTQPVMVHSFAEGAGGRIAVGASFEEGAAIMYTDNLTTWNYVIVGDGSTNEEPTVKYDPATGLWLGFIRRGGGVGNPRFWRSTDNLATAGLFTAPANFFGSQDMAGSPMPLQIRNGEIFAFGSYRSGTAEGQLSDEPTSYFLVRGPVTSGNFWTTAQAFRVGTAPHVEEGGASAITQASCVMIDDKFLVHLGMEERTGVTNSKNRVANLYQFGLSLADRGSNYDYRCDFLDVRGSTSPLMQVSKSVWALYNNMDNGGLPALFSGRLHSLISTSVITISGGILTLPGMYGGYIIDTEGAASTDDLVTINAEEIYPGQIIELSSGFSSRDTTVKHGVGNIYLNNGSDFVMSNVRCILRLQKRPNGDWVEFSRVTIP